MFNYWLNTDLKKLAFVSSFEEIPKLAISVIKRIPSPVFGLSFPLTTGGYGFNYNVKIIEMAYLKLTKLGFNVFNFLPLEAGIKPLKEMWDKNNSGYCNPILEVVYRGIFKSHLIETFFISPEWFTSEGAMWENLELFNLNIATIQFPVGFYKEILNNLNIEPSSEIIRIAA